MAPVLPGPSLVPFVVLLPQLPLLGVEAPPQVVLFLSLVAEVAGVLVLLEELVEEAAVEAGLEAPFLFSIWEEAVGLDHRRPNHPLPFSSFAVKEEESSPRIVRLLAALVPLE